MFDSFGMSKLLTGLNLNSSSKFVDKDKITSLKMNTKGIEKNVCLNRFYPPCSPKHVFIHQPTTPSPVIIFVNTRQILSTTQILRYLCKKQKQNKTVRDTGNSSPQNWNFAWKLSVLFFLCKLNSFKSHIWIPTTHFIKKAILYSSDFFSCFHMTNQMDN